jgi:hypothetical protein
MRDWWAEVSSALRRNPRTIAAAGTGLVAVVAGAIAALLLLTSSPVPSARPAPEPTRPVAGTARARPAPLVLSPFTGEPVSHLGPVIAVKIDNIVNARPQTGLQDADIVYVLPVEGGLSRFLAVYSSRLPPVIGPVRSAREDDLELLRGGAAPAALRGTGTHSRPVRGTARRRPRLLPL